MQNLEAHKLLEASPLFRNLRPQEAAAINTRLQAASYTRGQHILERGAWHGRLHIIVSGQVSVLLREDEEADEAQASYPGEQQQGSAAKHAPRSYVIAHLGPGECFGEMSLITGEPPTATIVAEQDTQLWSLAQSDFLTLTGTCPTLLHNINAILSQRLARANRQILASHSAERVWLALIDTPAAADTPLERSLVVHIANALAQRSRKRVLVLEMCAEEDAVGPHFTTHEHQTRPGLLDCIHDHSLLTGHKAPTVTPENTHFAALATLGTRQDASLDADASAILSDLATYYDYVLFVTTPATPAALVQVVEEQCLTQQQLATGASHPSRHVIALMSAGAPADSLAALLPHAPALFVAHVPTRPTIGEQDRYAAELSYPVTRLLPRDSALLAQCWERREMPGQVAPDAALTQAIDFTARYIAHQTVGIAFGGGGARGFAHLGVMERLLSYGVPLDYIAGCSSGIITPGMYLIGKSFAESEEIFLEVQRHIVQWSIPRTSIFSNRGLKRMLREICGETRFEDLTTPFAMVAVDLATRSGVVLDRGPLWQAGLASVALPGIFPPVLIGEHILMDAGMHDPVPIRLARQMGADILLASELGGKEPPTLERAAPWLTTPPVAPHKRARSPHIVDLLLRTYDLAMATIGMHSIREADVVIRPTLHRISLRQFSEGRKFVAAGREAVEQTLPMLHKHLPWL